MAYYASATWDAVPDATSYDIEFTSDNPPTTMTEAVTNASYGGTTLPGATVCFQVRADNSHGQSAWSSQVCFQNS